MCQSFNFLFYTDLGNIQDDLKKILLNMDISLTSFRLESLSIAVFSLLSDWKCLRRSNGSRGTCGLQKPYLNNCRKTWPCFSGVLLKTTVLNSSYNMYLRNLGHLALRRSLHASVKLLFMHVTSRHDSWLLDVMVPFLEFDRWPELISVHAKCSLNIFCLSWCKSKNRQKACSGSYWLRIDKWFEKFE